MRNHQIVRTLQHQVRTGLALAALLLATAAIHAQGPPEPLRNAFLTAAETVIDQATQLDIHAPAASFDPELASVTTTRNNLNTMADSDREHDIVSSIDDMLFSLRACRIQAVDNIDTAACQQKFSAARARAMESIDHHKNTNGAWVKN